MSEFAIISGQLFNGLSVGSILLLTALGLALSFGQMGVINMAHGDMVMAGGYLAYVAGTIVHGVWTFPFALLVAFVGSTLLGAVLEISVVRWLYGRPLDTLLATWGISLILQQSARTIFGAVGVEVVAPNWMSGTIATLPEVRLFIIFMAAAVLAAMALFIARTRWGLWLRAVHQDRGMAAALGVNTKRVDLLVFALGTGIAGLAGAALALIAPVTPTVGQSYIVYAFLIVIVGGMGSLKGTAWAALAVGLFSAAAQMITSVSMADVWLLVAVIAFIQYRPQGMFVKRSRALEGS